MNELTRCPMCGDSISGLADRCPSCCETLVVRDERDPGAFLGIASLAFAVAGIIWAFAVESDPLGRAGAGVLVGIAVSALVVSWLSRRHYLNRGPKAPFD